MHSGGFMREILYRGIESYYQSLEKFLIQALKQYFDAEWWEKGVTPYLSDQQRRNVDYARKKLITIGQHPAEDHKLDTTYFGKIIEGNWEPIFKEVFKQIRRDEVLDWFKEATEARHKVAHFDSIPKSQILSALDACEKILQLIDPIAASSIAALKEETQFGKPLPEQSEMEWALGDMYADQGDEYAAQGDYQQSIKAYVSFLSVNGGSGNLREGDVLCGLAKAHEALGKIPHAIEYFQDYAIFLGEFDLEDWSAIDAIYWKVGLLREQLGQLHWAIHEMELCIEWEVESDISEAGEHSEHLAHLRKRAEKIPPEPEYVAFITHPPFGVSYNEG
jgi:tetratricopeptide (TPR) repeat protein